MKTPFSLHLLEFRYRVLYIFLSFCFTFCVGTLYFVPLTHLLCTPLFSGTSGSSLFIFTHVTEGLYASLEVSFVCAFSFCLPLLVYQTHSFLIPSCYQGERKNVHLFLFLILFLLMLGFFAAAIIVLPEICNFLRQYQYSSKCMQIKLEARVAPAVHWNCVAFFWTLVFFQTPVIFTALCKAGLSIDFLQKNRKYVFFSLLLITSFLSPPDVSTQCVLACTGCLLYELLLWGALFFYNYE